MRNNKFDLQLFAEDKVDTMAGLEALLGGNTTNEPAPTEPPVVDTEPDQQGDTNPGGGQDLDVAEPGNQEPPQVDKPGNDATGSTEPTPDQTRQNAAFARLRAESTQANKIINELAQALGIDETDPAKKRDKLLSLAHEKLAKESNVPVELYKELNGTKEQLALMQQQQNQITARDKFFQLQKEYGLEQDDLLAFARQLDEQQINVVEDPSIDLEYHYYRLNRAAIEQKKVQAAVEAALKKSNAADKHSTTPPKQASRGTGEPAQVNSVSALEGLLDGK